MLRRILIVLGLALLPAMAAADPAERCAAVGNDDTVRPYERSMRPAFVRAFKRLFPDARGAPSDTMLADQASFRCMDGRLYACFVGANLPCAKIVTERDNPGADAFCRDNPDAQAVPLAASGHDTAFSYACRGDRAVVMGRTFELDSRGFAKDLWTPLE